MLSRLVQLLCSGGLLLALVPIASCHEWNDVKITVKDSNTGSAAEGYYVEVAHHASKVNHPGLVTGQTDVSGQVCLRVATNNVLTLNIQDDRQSRYPLYQSGVTFETPTEAAFDQGRLYNSGDIALDGKFSIVVTVDFAEARAWIESKERK